MADSLLFRKGTLAELVNADIINGSINITTDEPGIYVDFDGERKRVGDFQMFDTLDDAAKAARKQNLSKTALYYTVEGNYLLRWDGSNFTWINDVSDLRTSLQILEGSITGINNNIKAIIGSDGGSVDGTNVKSLKALTDAMKNVASDSTVADLQASVKANADAIEENKTAIETTNGIVSGIKTTIGSSTDTATAETIYGKIAANKAQLETQNNAIKTNAQAITEGDNAVKAIIGSGYSSSNTVSSAITALSSKVDTNTASINIHTTKIENLEKAIGAGGSVETQIDKAITELNLPGTYKTIADAKTDHDAIDAEIKTLKTATSTNAGAISSLNTKVDVQTNVSTAIANAVSPVSSRVNALEGDNTTNKGNISANAAAISANTKSIETNSASITANANAIKTEKDRMDAFMAAADLGDAAIDTLKEIQNYIVSDGQAAAIMTQNIADNAKAIDDLEDVMVAADDAIKTRLDNLENNTITEAGDTNLVIATDTNGNTTISFQWGSF